MADRKVIQMVAGPTTIPPDVRALYAAEYGSSDIEDAFFEDYGALCGKLQNLLGTNNDVVVMMGEVWCSVPGPSLPLFVTTSEHYRSDTGLYIDADRYFVP